MRNNDLGVKEAKLLETIVQRCYGLLKLYIFTDEELKKKELISTMQNIDWFDPLSLSLSHTYTHASTYTHTHTHYCMQSFLSHVRAHTSLLTHPSQRYLQSNVAFLEFIAKRQTALRLCGRAIHNCMGWETYTETTLLNASHNYIKEVRWMCRCMGGW